MNNARATGDEIRGAVFKLATEFLNKVKSGADPEQSAEKLRSASVSLIPGREGVLPTAADIEAYSTSIFNEKLGDGTRRSVMAAVIGTSSVAAVTLIVCAVLFQFHSSSSTTSPNSQPVQSPAVQFAQPKFN
jgi:hypothetical protein